MGRWKLWIIHQHFERDTSLQQVHAYNDLQTIKYRAKKGYVTFYNDWMTQLSINGPNAVDGVAKMALFLPEVRRMPEMAFHLQIFDRMQQGDPNKSYEWLVGQIEAMIERQRLESIPKKWPMVLHESEEHCRLMVVAPTPMAPRLLPRLQRMRSNKQSVLRRHKRQRKRC